MSAMNRHSVTLSGKTLREISERAAKVFDEFFDRAVAWEVVRFDSEAQITELKNGVGAVVGAEVSSWSAYIEAEANGIRIGAGKQEAAMLFKPLGS